MIKIQNSIPRKLTLACSGGVDSMAALDFLRKNHDVSVLFVHHRTSTSRDAAKFLLNYSWEKNIRTSIVSIDNRVPDNVSQEEHWRNERYKIFHSIPGPVVTVHHLNDCVETWVWSSLHGQGKIIPYSNVNVIRPFRATAKKDLVDWAKRHKVPWIEDKSNYDTRFIRNSIRHEMMPHILKVNPGIEKVIRKKVLEESWDTL